MNRATRLSLESLTSIGKGLATPLTGPATPVTNDEATCLLPAASEQLHMKCKCNKPKVIRNLLPQQGLHAHQHTRIRTCAMDYDYDHGNHPVSAGAQIRRPTCFCLLSRPAFSTEVPIRGHELILVTLVMSKQSHLNQCILPDAGGASLKVIGCNMGIATAMAEGDGFTKTAFNLETRKHLLDQHPSLREQVLGHNPRARLQAGLPVRDIKRLLTGRSQHLQLTGVRQHAQILQHHCIQLKRISNILASHAAQELFVVHPMKKEKANTSQQPGRGTESRTDVLKCMCFPPSPHPMGRGFTSRDDRCMICQPHGITHTNEICGVQIAFEEGLLRPQFPWSKDGNEYRINLHGLALSSHLTTDNRKLAEQAVCDRFVRKLSNRSATASAQVLPGYAKPGRVRLVVRPAESFLDVLQMASEDQLDGISAQHTNTHTEVRLPGPEMPDAQQFDQSVIVTVHIEQLSAHAVDMQPSPQNVKQLITDWVAHATPTEDDDMPAAVRLLEHTSVSAPSSDVERAQARGAVRITFCDPAAPNIILNSVAVVIQVADRFRLTLRTTGLVHAPLQYGVTAMVPRASTQQELLQHMARAMRYFAAHGLRNSAKFL